MKTKEQTNLLIDDMHFKKPDKEQEAMITRYSSREYKTKFRRRFIISLMITLIIILCEYIARRYTMTNPRPDTIPGMIIFMISVFIIYNIISYIYMQVKTNMNDILNRYECTYGIVTEKYDGRHLSQKSGEISHNYILFSNEEGHCTTALSVKNLQMFQSDHIGDKILLLK